VTEPAQHAEPSDAGVPRPMSAPNSPSGHPAVDAALAELDTLDQRPVHEHAAVFEAAHERLRAALDTATGTPLP